VKDCTWFDIDCGPSRLDCRLDHSQSLAYTQALLPLKAAKWPSQVEELGVRKLTLAADVRHVLQTIFPAATVQEYKWKGEGKYRGDDWW
jgi:hypothetical protein